LQKIKFETDYQEGAHPKILECLLASNLEQTSGYGVDSHCERAKDLIRKVIGKPNAEIFFAVGGTQSNTIAIKFLLNPCEGVISVQSGHINVHESGAIEATGHKVISLTKELKLTPDILEKFCVLQENDPNREHVVQGKMVYLSEPTEYGILYSKSELEEIYKVCKKYDLYFFIDGARLAFALGNYEKSNLKMEDIPNICDVMYIGGTKCGALFGEAVVIMNEKIKKDFRYHIKQRGAMMAKGRLLGIQFYELFKDNLYLEIGKKTVELALYLKEELKKKGVKLFIDSYTNQQFVILSKEKYEEISKKFLLSFWEENKDGIVCRICTSWATTKETLDSLISMF